MENVSNVFNLNIIEKTLHLSHFRRKRNFQKVVHFCFKYKKEILFKSLSTSFFFN